MTSAATPKPLRGRVGPDGLGWAEYIGSVAPMTCSFAATVS
jgi:hypothetical protein